MNKDRHLGITIDEETHRKLKSLAKYDGRSMHQEILHFIRKGIEKHESEHGPL